MRTLLTICVVSACTTPAAPKTPTPPEPRVAAPSCTDAGVLLRGAVSDDVKVGKLKEALITKVCTTDAWDAKILACVASKPVPAECLSTLATWHGKYGYDEDVPAGEGEDDPPPPEEDVDGVACEDAVKSAEAWPPALTLEGPDKMFASWPVAERACIVIAGGDACHGVAGRASRWGFPAAGVLVTTGIPECDEYGETLVKLAACDKLPESSRGSLAEGQR